MIRAICFLLCLSLAASQATVPPPTVFPLFTTTVLGRTTVNNPNYNESFFPVGNQILVSQVFNPILGLPQGWFPVVRISKTANTTLMVGDFVVIRTELNPNAVNPLLKLPIISINPGFPACPAEQTVLLNPSPFSPEITADATVNQLTLNELINNLNNQNTFCVWDINSVVAKLTLRSWLDTFGSKLNRLITPGQTWINP
jgi:hypothetical protein